MQYRWGHRSNYSLGLASLILSDMTKQDAYPPAERSRALFAYILDLSVNVGVTGAIVGKLWYRGRRTPALVPFSDSSDLAITNRYIGPIAVLLESGAIAAAMQLTDLIVLVVNQPLIVVTIWFSAQLSVSSLSRICCTQQY